VIYLSKDEKVKRIGKMLEALNEEEAYGGFNEYSQFCGEMLKELIPFLPHKALDYLMEMIEKSSDLGISRKNF
jgi:hypothetical protein